MGGTRWPMTFFMEILNWAAKTIQTNDIHHQKYQIYEYFQ